MPDRSKVRRVVFVCLMYIDLFVYFVFVVDSLLLYSELCGCILFDCGVGCVLM